MIDTAIMNGSRWEGEWRPHYRLYTLRNRSWVDYDFIAGEDEVYVLPPHRRDRRTQ